MQGYKRYCTKEQMRRAYAIGIPMKPIYHNKVKLLEIMNHDNDYLNVNMLAVVDDDDIDVGVVNIFTTQDMIELLREAKEMSVDVETIKTKNCFVYLPRVIDLRYGAFKIFDNGVAHETYMEAERDGIDTAIDYLEKGE